MIAPLRADDTPGVRLLAAGSLRAAHRRDRRCLLKRDKNQGGDRVRSLGRAARTHRERRGCRRLCLGRHGQPAGAVSGRQSGPGRAVRAQLALRAGPPGVFAHPRQASSPPCSIRRSSSVPQRRRPIRLATIPGRCSPRPTPSDRQPRYSGGQGAKADRRPADHRSAAGRRRCLCLAPARGHADVFIEYCSAGADFKKDLPGATVVNLPPELATGADYGLTLLPTKNENAALLAFFILSPEGQTILLRNGFDAPLLAQQGH